jgi:hypothetical protein
MATREAVANVDTRRDVNTRNETGYEGSDESGSADEVESQDKKKGFITNDKGNKYRKGKHRKLNDAQKSDNVAKNELYAKDGSVTTSDDDISTTSEGGWRTGRLELGSALAETHLEYEGIDGITDPFDQLLAIGDSSYMASNFLDSGHLDYLFHHEQHEEQKAIDERMIVTPKCMFTMLGRVSVGAAYRMKRVHITGDKGITKQAQYLSQTELPKFDILGKIVTRNPLPFPIRTYDMPTHFQREGASSSFPPLFGYDTVAKHYKMPSVDSIDDDILEQLILTSLIVRTTGRVERLREYLEYRRKTINGPKEWKRLFDSEDCRILPLFIAATSEFRDSTEGYKLAAAMTKWFSDQFKKAIPLGVKESPLSYAAFLNEFVRQISKIIKAIRSSIAIERKIIVKLICQIMNESSKGHPKKTESLMFIAHQIVADLEEVLSISADSSASPFAGDYVWPGYGGKAGFSVIDHDLVLKRMCTGPGFKRWNTTYSPKLFMEVCLCLKKYICEVLNDFDLALLGLERVRAVTVIVKLTFRYVTVNDIEQMLCKVYLAGGRSRGSRNHSISRTWRDYCWPPRRNDTVGCARIKKVITDFILDHYEGVVTDMITVDGPMPSGHPLLPLDHPFKDI